MTQILSTEEGTQIDGSEQQLENASLSIHESLESDSNVIFERELHSLKQYARDKHKVRYPHEFPLGIVSLILV
jgi:hypothetical protein